MLTAIATGIYNRVLVRIAAAWHHRRMAHQRIFAGLCLAALLTGAPSSVYANGRFPAAVSTSLQPADTQHILVPTTFGLLTSSDAGASFQWVCEDAVGYGGTYDPDYAITTAGRIYATTFSGLRYSDDGGCTFNGTQFYGDPEGGDNPVLLQGYWIGEVEIASDGKFWAATSTSGQSNNIYVSEDGVVFNSANNFHETAWWKSLRVAPSNPDVVYTSAYVLEIPDVSPSTALIRRTDDGGASWTELPIDDFEVGSQPNIIIEGISPSDPNIVIARVVSARPPVGDDIYRSIDGGQSWTKVLELGGTMSAFLIRSNESVIIATATPCLDELPTNNDASVPDKGCVRISPTGAANTFVAPAVEPKVGCLGENADGVLYGCGSNWEPDNFAFGYSEDNGDSWNKLMRFSEIDGPLACPAGTQQNSCAQIDWPSLCVVLGICESPDAGPSAAADAGVSTDDGGGGSCGCQAGGSGSWATLALLLGILFVSSRRRKTSR